MYAIIQDLRFALRCLLKSPAFTVPALLTLTLGIGSNTAMLSVANAVILRPLPGIVDTGGLAWVISRDRRSGHPVALRLEDLNDLRAAGAFEWIAFSKPIDLNLALRGDAERVPARLVNGDYFRALGGTAAHGRLFAEADEQRVETQPVAVLSWDFWQRRFGGDSGVIGQTLMLNGQAVTAIGVAPRGFIGAELADRPPVLWALVVNAQGRGAALIERNGGFGFEAVGRIRGGLSRGEAAAALDVLGARVRSRDASGARDVTFQLAPMIGGLSPGERGDALPVALVGAAVVGAVLLIACANVAGLLLARASRREREIGIRVALGATRGRLVRQLLTESALLAVVAGAGGLLLAWWGTTALTRALAVPLPLDLRPDATVLAGTLGVSLAAAIVFGTIPAIGAVRANVAATLAGATIAGPAQPRARMQRRFVVAQVALSVVLVATAGVLLRHLRTVAGADGRTAGADRLLVASFDLAGQGYADDSQRAFGRDLLRRLAQLPGVESASLASLVPLGGTWVPIAVEVAGAAAPGTRGPRAYGNWVWPDYFRTLGTPIVRGRGFTEADAAGSPPVAIVNETMARQMWPGEEPIGKRFRQKGRAQVTVIGVVSDSRYDSPGDAPAAWAFFPSAQHSMSMLPTALLVRARHDAAGILPIVRSVIAGMDRDLPVFDARTVEALLAERRGPQRAASTVLALFGGLALLLTVIGVYGVMAYAVERRAREIGVRVALGAAAGDVLRLMVREGASLAAAGVGTGVILSVVATRVFASFAGVPPANLNLLAGVSAIVVASMVAACWLPARRALAVDPTVTLRME